MPSSAARRKNFGFNSTSKAGTKVQEPKKLIPIHSASNNPISEQKRIFEKDHSKVATTSVIAVKVTAFPEVAKPRRTASVTASVLSYILRHILFQRPESSP